jgi:CTP synthase (UTP-ammonia lyase)
MEPLKIAIIGDYNFTFNAHHATNLSLDHASIFLDVEINYYWIKVSDVAQEKASYFTKFDAFWIAPGPFQNGFFLNGIFKRLLELKKPVLATGESFKILLEFLIAYNNLNREAEKLISENLSSGPYFEEIQITPNSKVFSKLYENFTHTELTATRYSLYPKLLNDLSGDWIDIEARNQFDDPEVFSLKGYTFFVACAFYPQVSSTRDIPHPIIYTFLKSAAPAESLAND